jgi:hypothetical protein
MTDDLVKRLREGRTKGSNLEWRVTAVHLEAAARIEELEAEVARLRDVQADADAIRKAALESAIAALNRVELCGKTPQEMHAALNQYAESRYAIFALIDNTGKEVMPDAPVRDRHADTGPGDQAVAGAAPRRASGPIDPEAGFATSGAEARWIAEVEAGVYDDPLPGKDTR